jgi:hypothetical protein
MEYKFEITLQKKEAIKIINKICSKNLNKGNTVFSNINDRVPQWWFEPPNEKFEEDLNIILNSQQDKCLYYFFIPKDAIQNPEKIFSQKNRTQSSSITINIDSYSFADNHSKFKFKPYLKEKVKYQGTTVTLEIKRL